MLSSGAGRAATSECRCEPARLRVQSSLMSDRGTLPRVGKSLLWFALSALASGGCDLGTKAWAERTLDELPGRSMMLLEPWFELALTYNRGTAFSLVPDLGTARWFFGIAAIAVVVVLLVIVARSRADRFDAIAFGAIAGGAIGNGYDRVFNVIPGGTGVVDFIKINYPWGGSWPTFNIADVLIAVGVAMLVLRGLRNRGKPKSGAEHRPDAPAPGTA